MENTMIKGRGAYEGVMEGEALVLPDSVQGWAGLDEKTGIIIEEANSKFGAYIGGKILILPCAKGSNGWASHFYSASVAGHKPIAWVIENWIPAVLPVLWNWEYPQLWRLKQRPARSFMTETTFAWTATREP